MPGSLGSFSAYFGKEKVMSSSNIRTKRSEKGLLTPDNCVVALIDFQPQMLFWGFQILTVRRSSTTS